MPSVATQVKIAQEFPTSRLRFIKRDGQRVLQQQWRIDEWGGDEPSQSKFAWRDVPLEEQAPASQG